MEKNSITPDPLWTMDDSIPYDFAILESISISEELQAQIDAIFDSHPTPTESFSAA